MPGRVVPASVHGRLTSVILFSALRGDRISEVKLLADPAKMGILDAEWTRT